MYQDFLNDVLSPRGNDIRVSLKITPQEAMQGTARVIPLSANMPCPLCGGSGGAPGLFKSCKQCNGQGVVPTQKRFQVMVPAGIRSGETLTYQGHGLYALFAQQRGDLYVQINVQADDLLPLQHHRQARLAPQPAIQPSFAHNAPTVADRSYQPASQPTSAHNAPTIVDHMNQPSSIPSSFGNYQVLQLLGSGGFANVYLGKHRYLGTQAAIKVLKEQLSQQALQSFVEEARTVATLKHSHIVRVLDFGVEGQTAFLAMDYAPSGTLRKLHPEGSQLPLRVVISYVKQVAAALQHAHDRNIVHRDIKPENMLVDTDKTVLLSDFGIALLVEHRTRSMARHEAIGTAAYMAPEQIKEKPRPASDQYSLAVVVYEWLCGTYPFDGPNDIAIALQHINTPPPPLRSHVPGISSAVEQVVLRALAKDPHQRFASVQAFAAALEQAL